MYVTLALVILLSAVFVLFSQDFVKIIKKLLKIKGVMFIVPIAIASWLVYLLNYYVVWCLYYCQYALQHSIAFIAKFIPFPAVAEPVITILFLTLISVGPVLLWDRYLWKKSYTHYPYCYLTSTLIWIVCASLLIVRV